MHKFQPLKNVKLANGKYMVTDNPNVDYAFVVALIAILDDMNNVDIKTSNSHVVEELLTYLVICLHRKLKYDYTLVDIVWFNISSLIFLMIL